MILPILSLIVMVISILLIKQDNSKFDVFAGVFGIVYSCIAILYWFIVEVLEVV